jgi:putative membrane protein
MGATPPSTTLAAQPDTEFLRKASSINSLEVDVAKLAKDQTQNDSVRAFAEVLAKDHADAKDRLKDLTETMKVDFPKEVLAEHKAIVDRLKTIKGPQFDREFINTMVDGHEQAIDLFQQEATSGKNAQLKAYAQSLLPTLKSHLDMAKDLQKKINTGENPGDMDNPGTPPSNPSLPPPSEPYTPPAGNPPSQPTQPGS